MNLDAGYHQWHHQFDKWGGGHIHSFMYYAVHASLIPFLIYLFQTVFKHIDPVNQS